MKVNPKITEHTPILNFLNEKRILVPFFINELIFSFIIIL